MSHKLLRAWKVVANPDASESEWLSACRLIGDKKPPLAVLESEGISGLVTSAERNRRLYLTMALLTGRLGAFILDGLIMAVLLIPILCSWMLVVDPYAFSLEGHYLVSRTISIALLEQFSLFSTAIFSLSVFQTAVAGLNTVSMLPVVLPLTAFLSLFYHVAFQISPLQGTIGERLFCLRVTSRRGHRLTVAQAALRHFARLLCPLSLGFAYLLPLINRNQCSIEDVIADTRVRSIDEEKTEAFQLSLFPYSSDLQTSI